MFLEKKIEILCRSVASHPVLWLILTFIPVLPALYEIQNLGLNSDIARLLPEHSPAAMWTRDLEKVVGDGGFFTILLKGDDRTRLVQAVEETAARVKKLAEVDSVTYSYPVDFIEKYRYLLISNYYLEKTLDYTLALKAQLSPFTADLLSPDTGKKSSGKKKEHSEIRRLLEKYSNLTPYHESKDGKIFGIFIRPGVGFSKIKNLHGLLNKLEKISVETSEKFAVWSGVGGSQIDNLKEYDVIRSDLKRSGLITVTGVLLILVISFRSITVLPVLLYPLSAGLLWSFALVPPILGDLNIITSFLLLVLFGLGIDYAIHLVKRFQQELAHRTPQDALIETYRSTGLSVITSGLTTGLALLVLAFSDFRGFSEFGMIGGGTMLIMLVAMFTVMPPTLLLAEQWHLVRPDQDQGGKRIRTSSFLTVLIALLLPCCIILMAWNLRFDFNFNKLKPRIPGDHTFNSANSKVYKTRYMSPGAIYVAPDLQKVDELLLVLNREMTEKNSFFLKTTSIRNFAPSPLESRQRLELISEIQEQLEGSWIKKIKDPLIREWVGDMRAWVPPAQPPSLQDLPENLTSSLLAGPGKNLFLVGLYPNVTRGNGKNAMGFTREMYNLKIPEGIQGPVGEMPIFAEILWTVTAEGPWVLIFSFVAVFLLIMLGFRSFKATVWITLPLLSGLVLTMGIMAATGFRLNFFNVVIFPALVGMGVDSGVHFYRRWKDLEMDTGRCLHELFGPLTICTVTSMMGYSGMVFASHPGLRSIGILACLGLGCIWLTSLVLFPGLLDYFNNRK